MKQRKLTEEQIARANRLRLLQDGDGYSAGTCVGIEEPMRWTLVEKKPILLRRSDIKRLVDEASQSGRASRRASGEVEATTSEPVGARIRRLREAAGLSQRVLARLLSRKDGRSEGAWQASLARTETGDIEPPAEQLDSILRELGDDEEGRARAAVASVLTAEVLADWCTRHDPVEISRALASYATMVPMMARRNR